MPIKITMPALSPTMEEGKLAKWLKKEGDRVSAGDVIAEIETDKATMEVEAVDEGTLAKILVAEGTEGVKVNAVIALLLAEGEDKAALAAALEGFKSDVGAAPAPAKPAEAPKPAPASPRAPAGGETASASAPAAALAPPPPAPRAPAPQPAPHPPRTNGHDRVFASPLAKRMAKQAGVDLGALKGSGPHGRIVKSDIEAALSGGAQPAPVSAHAPGPLAPPPRPTTPYTDIPLSTVRKVIAKRMTEAHTTIPVFYLTVDCEIDRLLAARAEINDAAPKDKKTKEPAYKVSVNDLVIKAAACALRAVPAVNAQWGETVIRQLNTVDVSVAVAYEGGLITPIIWNADQKGVAQIAAEMKALAERARAGKLKPEEYQGGGFSISNLGMYGMKQFTAVINPPQACILAVAQGELRPIVRGGKIEVATIMSVTLACDHRVVDGATGATWVQSFKGFIEKPATMLA
jgi:pyruvate dehydrogenase E2 component (dihydrolipoyllysine-residue acetyltransferase)